MGKENLYSHSPLKPDNIYTKYYQSSSENRKKDDHSLSTLNMS